jgi:hypothetical protein
MAAAQETQRESSVKRRSVSPHPSKELIALCSKVATYVSGSEMAVRGGVSGAAEAALAVKQSILAYWPIK